MKPGALVKLSVPFAAMLLVIVAQARIISQLRNQNNEFRTVTAESGRQLAESKAIVETANTQAAEVEPLRAQIAVLNAELAKTQKQLTNLTRTAMTSDPFRHQANSLPPTFVMPVADKVHGVDYFSDKVSDALKSLAPGPAGSVAFLKGGGQIDGVPVSNVIAEHDALSGPDWSPAQPLPLDFTSAELLARAELRKIVPNDSSWILDGIDLHHSSDYPRKWHYLIHLSPHSRSDYLIVNVGMNGKVGTTHLGSVNQ